MVDIRNLKSIVFNIVSDFMDDFRVSLTQELTQLLNFSSENNSTRLHSNLDYFREELVTWKAKQSKEVRDLEAKVVDLEGSLTTVLQIFDQKGLLNIFSSKDTYENPENISVEENVLNPKFNDNQQNSKCAKPQKKLENSKKSQLRNFANQSDEELCNFSHQNTLTESLAE